MDLLNDRLPFAGLLGLRARSDGHNDSDTDDNDLANTRSRDGLLKPLRRLLQPSFETLRGLYLGNGSSGEAADLAKEGQDYRSQVLKIRLNEARSYHDWLTAATGLDSLEGKDVWKTEEDSSEYDVDLVRARLIELDEARMSRDQGRILMLVRTALTRNLGGMGDLRLYKHCRVGTKVLIEQYIESVSDTINTLLDMARSGEGKLDSQSMLQELLLTRQAFGRSALLLSGGGTFGMNHIGVIKALFEASLLPRIISGASAGSIVCAVLCTKTDAEIPHVLRDFCYGDLAVFEKPGAETSLLGKAFRFLTKGSLFDISNLVGVMKDILGDMTFQEAYNRTRRILNICVSSASLYELPRLLNYITAPNVMIWSAVAASCSVPLIYTAAQLLVKDPRTGEQGPWNQSPQRWIDGSVENDLPTTRLAEMFNVNHFIVSQVNPHVVPFLEKDEQDLAADAERSTAAFAAGPDWIHTLTKLARDEAMHRLHVMQELRVLPNVASKLRAVLGQRYSGDITILPKVAYSSFPRVLKNPDPDFMLQAMLSGERATWPKMGEVRNHCAIELALDEAVHALITSVAFSPSQTDLRRFSSRINPTIAARPTQQDVGGQTLGPTRKHRTSIDLTNLNLDVSPKTTRKSVWFGMEGVKAARHSPKVAGPRTGELWTSDSEETLTVDHEDSDGGVSGDESFMSQRPSLWPSTRQLFPSASQPTTPSAMRHMSGPLTPRSAHLIMTPAAMEGDDSQQSSPEKTYKRLFHGSKSKSISAIHTAKDSVDLIPKRSNSLLDLDISGTKGMMRRRKRSLSTGLRNLAPPKSVKQ